MLGEQGAQEPGMNEDTVQQGQGGQLRVGSVRASHFFIMSLKVEVDIFFLPADPQRVVCILQNSNVRERVVWVKVI